MKRIAIICDDNTTEKLIEMFSISEEYYLLYIVTDNCEKWGYSIQNKTIISIGHFIELYNNGQLDKIVMSSLEDDVINQRIYQTFITLGVSKDDIMYLSYLLMKESNLDDEKINKGITTFYKRRELETMEIHVAEHCNLNCKNCSMFCGLVKAPEFIDFDSTKQGIEELRKHINHIKKFRIIGGEPLLNKELYKYIDLIRTNYPFTDIRLISNGILILKMSDQLINSLVKNNVTLIITSYAPVIGKMEEIHAFLQRKRIRHIITDTIIEFQKIYNYKGSSDGMTTFENCNWKKSCATMYGTQIATCFVPFVIRHLSDAFSLNIEQDGVLELQDKYMSAEKIQNFMERPLSLCRFCSGQRISEKWNFIHNDEERKNIASWSV